MLELNFTSEPGYNHHECESSTEGDWIVFRCPICKNYERRINMLTGETTVNNISAVVSHSGRHIPLQQGSMMASPELN